jgi:hypothetical protein
MNTRTTYLLVIALIVASGLSVAAAVCIYRAEERRDLETQLFFDSRLHAETVARARIVIVMLEDYRKLHGSYPRQLDQLELPNDLLPVAGRQIWHYTSTGDAFQLSFGAGRACYPCRYYRSQERTWKWDK